MSVSFVQAGTLGSTGTSTLSVNYPATTTSGNIAVLIVVNKYPGAAPATPSGWTAPANNQGSGGAGASGIDTGETVVTAFVKELAGTEGGTSVSVTITGNNSACGAIFEFSRSGGASWGYTCTYGADTTGGTTTISITGAADIGIATGDMVLFGFGKNSDTYVFGSHTLTATGATIGSVTERIDAQTANGDDCGLLAFTGACTSGTSSAAPVAGATANSSNTDSPAGAGVFVRLYEVSGALSTPYVSVLPQRIIRRALR
jgi:hypothetical protein